MARAQLNETIRQRIWDCLDRGARTGYEIVLPRMSSRPESELMFLVLNSTAQVSTEQLRTRLMRDAQLDEHQVDVQISAQNAGNYEMSDGEAVLNDTANLCHEIERVIQNRMRQ